MAGVVALISCCAGIFRLAGVEQKVSNPVAKFIHC